MIDVIGRNFFSPNQRHFVNFMEHYAVAIWRSSAVRSPIADVLYHVTYLPLRFLSARRCVIRENQLHEIGFGKLEAVVFSKKEFLRFKLGVTQWHETIFAHKLS